MQLPRLFTNGCVLRMGTDTRIWGKTSSNERVTVAFQGKTYYTNADFNGDWNLGFDLLEPGGPYVLRAESPTSAIVLRDVYVGEVWLCAGQSNMQITFARIGRRYPEIMSAPSEQKIRCFLVEPAFSGEPQLELATGEWKHAAPQHISGFSAIGYFFAKKRLEHTGVPVGMITTAVGGTAISSWQRTPFIAPDVAPQDISEIPAPGEPCDPTVTQGGSGVIWWHKFVNITKDYVNQPAELALGTIVDADITYVNGVEVGRTEYRYPPRYYAVPPLAEGTCEIVVRQTIFGAWGKFTEGKTRELRFPNGTISLDGDWLRRRIYQPRITDVSATIPVEMKPCVYFNAMIAPLTNYSISGALWYQGESDASAPNHYAAAFSHMLNNWRDGWKHEFPILTVGLARWDESDWTALREQQKLCAQLPGVGYFDAWQYGEPNDLHPLEKKPIGEGLADISFQLIV